ncbi:MULTISPECIES: hypothetical protein [Micromonospora]|uniref:hypothetical protein n=1 Tax=Micromonospora TaxID=1873 RepID=UPI003405756F
MIETIQKTRAVQTATEPAWLLCRDCRQPLYLPRFVHDLRVCEQRSWHGAMTASERLDHLFDPGSRTDLTARSAVDDPLGVVDVRPYRDRLYAARAGTGLVDGAVGATGKRRAGDIRA